MLIKPLKVKDAYEITLKPFHDQRGYFIVTYDPDIFTEHGLTNDWVQENQSGNLGKGILRGLHFQRPPHAETKLVRAVVGTVFDMFLDLRRSSPSYGKWDSVILSADKFNMVYIPKGCAHAYCTISEESIIAYKVDARYAPEASGGIRWDDPDLNIPWPLEDEPILSERDMRWGSFTDFESPF